MFIKLKTAILRNTSLLIVLTLFISSLMLLHPFGNYPVNDDFYYLIQLDYFSTGNLIKSAFVTPSFVLQGGVAIIWAHIAGLSFSALRLLTIIFAVLSIGVFSNILTRLTINQKLHFFALILFAFNPFFYINTPTFMTEVYFMFFVLLSVDTFISFIDTPSLRLLLIAGLFAGLSGLVRQFGGVLFVAYMLYIAIYFKERFTKEFVKQYLVLLPGVILLLIGIFWPHYSSDAFNKSKGISSLFVMLSVVPSRVFNISFLPYLFISIGGFLFAFLAKLPKKFIILAFLLGFVPFVLVYNQNIFPIGNTLFIEGLYANSQPVLREHLFNNFVFRFIFSYLCGVSGITFLLFLTKNFKQIKSSHKAIFFAILTTLFYIVAVVPVAQYDRYLMLFITSCLLLIVLLLNSFVFTKLSTILLSVFTMLSCLFIYFLTFDYYAEKNLENSIAAKMRDSGLGSALLVSQTNSKYDSLLEKHNYNGLKSIEYDSEFNCFVLNYVKYKDTTLQEFTQRAKNTIHGKPLLDKTVIEEYGFAKHYVKTYQTKDTVSFDEEYFSPIYNLFGFKMAVRGYCKIK